MNNTAILVGNTEYEALPLLSCCGDDLIAMKALLSATGRYSDIVLIENADAHALKSGLRAAIENDQTIDEVFFYFTGHGCQQHSDFYFCATGFDPRRPNETGISTNELHDLLRMAEANVVVKVIDACNSGTILIKSGRGFALEQDHRFQHLIQISSCLESQNSLGGAPLSLFTEKFRDAALRKTEGIVYYTDIMYALRDEFLQNDDQTPHFVSQATGRERFSDSAQRFDSLRQALSADTQSSSQSDADAVQAEPEGSDLRALLRAAESKAATPEKITSFVGDFLDGLRQRVSNDVFSDFFELEVVEHSDFYEQSAEDFIARVLSRQSRLDKFVTAERESTGHPLLSSGLLGIFGGNEKYDLRLNCSMTRAQLRVTMTPKYHSLKMLNLVVTCAPSLEQCYVFEVVTEHGLEDFGSYDAKGDPVVRRWYKHDWCGNTDELIQNIVAKLEEIVRVHLERTEQRLIEG